MIILAGITLVALSGENGILRQASKAKEETGKAEEKEQEDLKELEQQIILNTEVWSGTVGNSYAGGTGSKEDPYTIENGEQLAYLAEQVNNGEKYTGKYFKIIKSINLGGANWIPIGGNTEDVDSESNNYFDGELDGQDNLIANLSITQNNTEGIGLIGILGEKGLIKNIKVSSGNVTGKSHIGAIVGNCSGQVNDCINNAKISINGAGEISYHGGFVGFLETGGRIINCINQGQVEGIGNVAIAGGISGYIGEETTVQDCLNKGTIKLAKESNVPGGSSIGGIIGNAIGFNSNIINCTNEGLIESDNVNIGGIVGTLSYMNIKNCVNNGNIIGASQIGGIVGFSQSEGNRKIENCKNNGNVESIFYSDAMVGGIVGYSVGYDIYNCYNTGNVKAEGLNVGGIASVCAGNIIEAVNQGNIEGASYVSGIVVQIQGDIKKASNTGKVYAKGSEDVQAIAGGIAMQIVGTLENAYNSGIVEVGNTDNKIDFAGGIVALTPDDSIIKYSYNKGEIKGADEDVLGNIVGQRLRLLDSTIENCYYYTESEIKGIGSEGEDIDIKNPVEDTVGVTEKVEDNIETYEEFLTWIEGKKE